MSIKNTTVLPFSSSSRGGSLHHNALDYLREAMPIFYIPYVLNLEKGEYFPLPLVGPSFFETIADSIEATYRIDSLKELLKTLNLAGFKLISNLEAYPLVPFNDKCSIYVVKVHSDFYLTFMEFEKCP